MRIIAGFLIFLTLAAGGFGCRGMHIPRIQGPGTAPYQRGIAERFDPYPENDVGPAVVGGRPRDFDRPAAEPVRAGWLRQPPIRSGLPPSPL
ncbi:MAG: membrane or secreted protein [Pirellulales bacterium]|jgi:hypothetical protein|nr:membrane or secreted protein [Thermoguttaceae bacterium]MDD4786133.1 membrane or secreted protein [Pirellulales bacterium]NLZ02054.1 membrane or secreted protein [Pirellulaceae bacterium]